MKRILIDEVKKYEFGDIRMKKKWILIFNIALLFWYFLSMAGMKIGDEYLVTSAFEEEWIFMFIPITTFILMLITKKLEELYIWYG